jgi:predicted transcriptional regulator
MKLLTKAEEQMMEALWKIDKGFLKDVMEVLPSPKPHSNTVATIIKILIEKEYVGFEQQGRNNLYKVRISRAQYAKRSITTLVKNYFQGSPANVVSHFIDDKKISISELEELLKQIKSSKK